MMCKKCGGTGDRFDEETNDWGDPMEPCPYCNGWGEVEGESFPE